MPTYARQHDRGQLPGGRQLPERFRRGRAQLQRSCIARVVLTQQLTQRFHEPDQARSVVLRTEAAAAGNRADDVQDAQRHFVVAC